MSKARGLADLGNVYSDGALSNRNIIINGAMQVSQRGAFDAATNSTHNSYTLDRWLTTTIGMSSTVQKQSATLPNGSETTSTKITSSTTVGSGAYFGQTQIIEDGQRILRSGGTWVVSGWIRTNRNDVIIRVGGVANIGLPAVGDGNWQYYTATFNYTLAGNGDQSIGFLAYNNGNSAVTAGDYIEFTKFQIEVGDTATPFENRSYGQELALCKRYFQALCEGGGDTPIMMMSNYTTTQAYGTRNLEVEMRVKPTMFVGNQAAFRLYSNGTNRTTSSLSAGPGNTKSIEVFCNFPAAVAGAAVFMRDLGGGNITLDAEL
jgi:hypothetical protein